MTALSTRIGTFEFPPQVLDYLSAHGHDRVALRRYAARVPTDLAGMAPWIEGHTEAIWDIGCGLAGLTALICRRYPVGRFMLTDGDGSAGRKVGYCDQTKGWFDVEVSRAFVAANRIALALEQRADWQPGQCTLAFSLKSWGHHYPVGTYLTAVRDALARGGRLVLDIRTGTDGAERIAAAGFRELGLIDEKPKRRRLVFERTGDA